MRTIISLFFVVVAAACSRSANGPSSTLDRSVETTTAASAPSPDSLSAGTVLRPLESPRTPMRVGNGVTAPITMKRVEPDYAACKPEELQGLPILEAVIDEQGKPTRIRLLKPLHPCFERIMVAALEQWEFKPGTFEGKPVPVIFNLTVNIHWR